MRTLLYSACPVMRLIPLWAGMSTRSRASARNYARGGRAVLDNETLRPHGKISFISSVRLRRDTVACGPTPRIGIRMIMRVHESVVAALVGFGALTQHLSWLIRQPLSSNDKSSAELPRRQPFRRSPWRILAVV